MGMNTILVCCDECETEFEQHGQPRRRGLSGIRLCPTCKKKANDAFDPDVAYDQAREEGRIGIGRR